MNTTQSIAMLPQSVMCYSYDKMHLQLNKNTIIAKKGKLSVKQSLKYIIMYNSPLKNLRLLSTAIMNASY